MTHNAVTELAVLIAAVAGLATFVGLVMVPVVSAYERAWERLAAGLLSLWVLGAFVGLGALAGGLLVYEWPRLF